MTDTPAPPSHYIVDPAQADQVLTALFHGTALLWVGAHNLTFGPHEADAELAWNRLLYQVRQVLGEELVGNLEADMSALIERNRILEAFPGAEVRHDPESALQDDTGQ